MVAFTGWPAEAFAFFEGLEADNSKAYWHANKETYDRSVRGPLDELLAELEPEFGPGRAFRPYRDVRFSKDKSPYKTSAAALVGATGYLALSAHGITAGAGMVHLAADQLDRYRRAVDDAASGGALEDAVAAVRAAGHQCEPHDPLKTAPKGYRRDHPRAELLRGRGLIMWHEWPPAPWLGTAAARERLAAVLRDAAPLTGWLDAHVGPSELPPRRH
jgi:uncharacterized protein (TIGR02453 family)